MNFEELNQLQQEVDNAVTTEIATVCQTLEEFFDNDFDLIATEVFKSAIKLGKDVVAFKLYFSYLDQETSNVYLQFSQFESSRTIGIITNNKPFSAHWQEYIKPCEDLIKTKLESFNLHFDMHEPTIEPIGGGEAPVILATIYMKF